MTTNKIREALEQAKEIARTIYSTSETGSPHEDLANQIVELANAALAEPVKNCEVGTAEELYVRYEKFCCSHFNNEGDNCLKCPFSQPTCKFAWAQMPYAEQEGGAK